MTNDARRLPWNLFLIAVLATGALLTAETAEAMAAATATTAAQPRPLPMALVGPDTLTTTDLTIELALMRARNVDSATAQPIEPRDVLKRMTQNQLIVQEGYRMGLEQEFSVRNQTAESVRHECMKALLDSVALSIPAKAEDVHEKRRLAVKTYLDRLARAWGASVDSTVLRSLDYGSAEEAVQARLRESTVVLARLSPTRTLTVADFSRELRFAEFHGVVGKPDAAERRDKVLREYFSEYLLNLQLKAQRMDQVPRMKLLRQRQERNAVLEEGLRILLTFDFAPTENQIKAYYKANAAEVTTPARIKVASLKVATAEIAGELRAKLLNGTTVHWLTANDARVVKGASPFPEDWLDPEAIGLKRDALKTGAVPDPYEVPGGWVVAQIVEIERPQPEPLDSCRDRILALMKREQTRDHLVEILARLEIESPITILPGAEQEVIRALAETATVGPDTKTGAAVPSAR
jgi:hypothetical protein